MNYLTLLYGTVNSAYQHMVLCAFVVLPYMGGVYVCMCNYGGCSKLYLGWYGYVQYTSIFIYSSELACYKSIVSIHLSLHYRRGGVPLLYRRGGCHCIIEDGGGCHYIKGEGGVIALKESGVSLH